MAKKQRSAEQQRNGESDPMVPVKELVPEELRPEQNAETPAVNVEITVENANEAVLEAVDRVIGENGEPDSAAIRAVVNVNDVTPVDVFPPDALPAYDEATIREAEAARLEATAAIEEAPGDEVASREYQEWDEQRRAETRTKCERLANAWEWIVRQASQATPPPEIASAVESTLRQMELDARELREE